MRSRRLLLLCVAAVIAVPAGAQHNPYEYYISGTSSQFLENSRQDADLTLFYSPLEGRADVFTRLSEFNFSAVRYSRRGFDMPAGKVYVGNIELSGSLTGRHDYTLYSALRRSRMPKATTAGSLPADAVPGLAGGVETFMPDPFMMRPENRVSLFGYNRNGKLGANVTGAFQYGTRYSAAYNIMSRGGKDTNIDGVESAETVISVLQKYRFDDSRSLTAGVFWAYSRKNPRSSATKEAFGLTGDNYYNPSWGYLDGRKRNPRERVETPGLVFFAYDNEITRKTSLRASAAYRFGESAYSSLAWFDAETPYPDYYRYMPGYYGDTPTGESLREKWRSKDPSVTQIDWERICEVNRYAGQLPVEDGGARYLIEDRVERYNDLQAAVSARTRIDNFSGVDYGVRLRRDDVRYFKRAKDMLGGTPFLNADQYLADTTRYGGRWLNDMRNPDKLVDKGDKFGYDYHLRMQKYEVYGIYHYVSNRLRLSAAAELGSAVVKRVGNYEKELDPGAGSYGGSEKIKLDTYTAKLSGSYSFSPRHIARLTGLAAETAPAAADMFVAPEHSNMTINDPRTMGVASVEAEYLLTLNNFVCKFTGFYTSTSHETSVYSYYDDIQAVYSDMVLSGISKRFYGVELGAQYDFSPRLALSLAASAGKYEYTSNPAADIYDDALLRPYVENSRTYLNGYRIGNTPELAASAELRYNMYGFTASLTLNYMGRRYVTANPLRRMERAYNLTDSPERFNEFVTQEKLSDAVTADLFLMKSFDLRKGAMTLLLSVNNLLNKKDIIYSGYEQMRVMRRGTGLNRHYVPFDSKYLYSYQRSFYLSATYRF